MSPLLSVSDCIASGFVLAQVTSIIWLSLIGLGLPINQLMLQVLKVKPLLMLHVLKLHGCRLLALQLLTCEKLKGLSVKIDMSQSFRYED